VLAVEVVTADGDILLCSKDQNCDLFWAARGAGPGTLNSCLKIPLLIQILGFPAIVTAFHLEVRNRFSNVMKSTFIWPLEQYKTVLDWTIDVSTASFYYLPRH